MYNIIKNLCDRNNISASTLAKTIGISRSAFTELKTGRSKSLSSDIICKIADYFNVTTDYILGRSLSERNISNLSDEQVSLLLNYAALTDEQKIAVNIIIKQFLSKD